MANKSLTEAFEVKPKVFSSKNNFNDYEIFSDKSLLEELRVKIVQNLIEENIPDDALLEEFLKHDKTLRNTIFPVESPHLCTSDYEKPS